jgi:hypothetical protein
MSIDRSRGHEAEAIRKARQVARRRQPDDPLVKRAKTLAFWIARDPDLHPCARVTPRFPHIGAFYRHPGFRRYLMPKLQQMLKERERAKYRAWVEEMRATSERFRQAKAEKAAAKERESAPQKGLFA